MGPREMDTVGMKCIKYLLVVFNLVFLIAGVVLAVAGALILTKFKEDFAFIDSQAIGYVAIAMIAIGGVMCVISFFGCCGAYRENHVMLLIFAVLLGLVFISEIGAAVAAHFMRSQIDMMIRGTMMKSIKDYPGHKALKDSWDNIQHDLYCCGTRNYTDWELNPNLNGSVPDSCCIQYSEGCGKDVLTTHLNSNIFQDGCEEKFLEASLLTVIVVLVVAATINIFKFIGIIFACFLAANIRSGYKRM